MKKLSFTLAILAIGSFMGNTYAAPEEEFVDSCASMAIRYYDELTSQEVDHLTALIVSYEALVACEEAAQE